MIGSRASAVEEWTRAWTRDGLPDISEVLRNLELGRFHQAVGIVESWAGKWTNAADPYWQAFRYLRLDAIHRVADFGWWQPLLE